MHWECILQTGAGPPTVHQSAARSMQKLCGFGNSDSTLDGATSKRHFIFLIMHFILFYKGITPPLTSGRKLAFHHRWLRNTFKKSSGQEKLFSQIFGFDGLEIFLKSEIYVQWPTFCFTA